MLAGTDLAVATSGTYERGLHVVNPRTGAPARTLRSVTVVGPTSATPTRTPPPPSRWVGRRWPGWPGWTGTSRRVVTEDAELLPVRRPARVPTATLAHG